MKIVVDASVVVKWALPDSDREANVPQALHLLAAIQSGTAILALESWGEAVG